MATTRTLCHVGIVDLLVFAPGVHELEIRVNRQSPDPFVVDTEGPYAALLAQRPQANCPI